MPSHRTSSFGWTTSPLGSLRLAVLASLTLVKCISSVLARLNSIAFSIANSYNLATSLSRIRTFFLRLVEEVVKVISSIYENTCTDEARLGNRSLM